MQHAIAVYGATGHTGRFVSAELVRRDVRHNIVGRDFLSLAAMSEASPLISCHAAALDDVDSLDRALAGVRCLINCAGPYLDTAAPLIAAAVRCGVHYVDLTAEQAAAQAALTWDCTARSAGVTVLPSAAFFGGLADLLATVAVGEWDNVDSIVVATALDGWHPTEGTRATGARNTVPRVVVRDGALQPMSGQSTHAAWEFSSPFGVEPMLEVPLSEIITIHHHITVRDVQHYLNTRSLEDLRDPTTPRPTAVDAEGRSAQRWAMEAVARLGGRERRARATGRDIYASSAPIAVEAALRLLRDPALARGAAVLGELFDAADFLHSIAGEDFAVAV
jgi:hypothetical protein